jgi:choline-sulfatase
VPTRSTRRSLGRACVALLAFACGSDPSPVNPPAEPELSAEPPAAQQPVAERRPDAGGDLVRVRYDLARHVARAELFHGDARVIDLGAASGHQHTLGGWRTRTGDTRELDGASASVIRDVTGFFVVPLEAERCTVSMRVRGFGARQATLYVDDQTAGFVELPSDGAFAVVRATIPSERCTPGEHELRLRVASTGSAPGLPRAGLAVDWMRLGPAGDPQAEVGPPAPDALMRAEGVHAALAVPDGWTVAYPFEVPEGARLRGVARGAGRVRVQLERDGAAASELGTLTGSPEGTTFDLDLAPHAPHVVRLRLRAEGDVTLVRPAVVTLDAVTPRSIPRVRNVVVYLTDTLRADHLRPYTRDTRVQTPGLSAWAERAATFLGAHSQENWTKPSVATLLSGLFPWEHHATSEAAEVPGSVELLSERLSDRGFHTGAFVANGFVSDRFGFRQGWGMFRNYVREGRRNLARFVAADVIEWLDRRPTDRPFFLYVHTIDPHVPYIPPAEDLARYDPEPYEGVVDFHRDRTLLERIKAGRIRLNERDRHRLGALYDGEITYHDRHFASVVQALEQRGLADDTLVIFTSDHGEELFDHGSVGHGHSVYEEIIRVPLIVRWPGLTDGAARVEEAVGLVDVMPTILEALGQEVPESLSGRSIAPLLAGRHEPAPRPTVTGFMEGWRTVVVGRYKLVQRTTSRWMLYDLVADPGEQTDLAAERPLAVRYLRGLLGLALAQAERPARPAPAHQARRTVIDDTLRQQLEALGYAGASRAPTDDGTGDGTGEGTGEE